MKIDISIIYVYYNTPIEIKDSLSSLRKAIGNLNYEVIIVDNNSTLKIPSTIKFTRLAKVIKNKKNFGYGKAINQAGKSAKGEYLLIVNPDVLFGVDAIKSMIKRIKKDNNIGVLGPQTRNRKYEILQSMNGIPFLPDALFVFSSLNKLWRRNPWSKRYWLYNYDKNKEHEVGFIGGACMLVRKSVFNKIHGFDENFFMYFEEADFCLRVKRIGYKIIFYPKAKVVHLVSKSSNDKELIRRIFEKSRFYFLRKYHGLFLAIVSEMIFQFDSRLSSFYKKIKHI